MAQIHHVQIAIPAGGEEAARGFYGGLLGLVEITKPESLVGRGGVWFRTGNLDLHIGVDPDFVPAKKAHIAYLVDDLAVVQAAVINAGYPIVTDVPLPGFDRFHTEDSFGNRVEILAASV